MDSGYREKGYRKIGYRLVAVGYHGAYDHLRVTDNLGLRRTKRRNGAAAPHVITSRKAV